MKSREEGLSRDQKATLNNLLSALADVDVLAAEGSQGYDLKWEDSRKSLYVQLRVAQDGWTIFRHQIRTESLRETLDLKGDVPALEGLDFQIERMVAADGYNIVVEPARTDPERLALAIRALAHRP